MSIELKNGQNIFKIISCIINYEINICENFKDLHNTYISF